MNKLLASAALAGCIALSVATGMPAGASPKPASTAGPLGSYKNVVVIYEENHSFDNLYGSWGKVNGQAVNGVQNVSQVTKDGRTYTCLLQNDVNLTSPTPLPATCTDTTTGKAFVSHFANQTFTIDDYIPADATTCPVIGAPYRPNGWLNGTGTPGGCTEDLVHRFYQEQYQIDGGKQDRYVTGSDAVGLTMGTYDTKQLPIYQYLHSPKAPNYVLGDNFFQAAFGGSFLNHQFLIAACAPLDSRDPANLRQGKNSVLDANGMPTASYPLYTSTATGLVDGQLTVKCADGSNNYAAACGNYGVNTMQPASAPAAKSGAVLPLIDDKAFPNIGDRMTAAGVTWNWYSGGWDDAVAGKPGPNFQYHHQPFNYFADYAVGGSQRGHLQDEKNFISAAKAGTLPQVSFVKPYGDENEHPGYASEPVGSDHLVDLISTIVNGPQAKDTLIVVTYDEFGGFFDHVSVPKGDKWGPGTRIPALFISAGMQHSGVDHTQYDTTSILATIEHQYGLAPLSSRDATVSDLSKAIQIGGKMPATSQKWQHGNATGQKSNRS